MNTEIGTPMSTPISTNLDPWYLRLMLGFSGWVAAIFLIGFMHVGFPDVMRNALSACVLGVLLCAAAYGLFRAFSEKYFVLQFALALSLAGQGTFVMGLANATKDHHFWLYFGSFILQIVLLILIPNAIHRFLNTVGAVVAWSLYTQEQNVVGLNQGLIALAFAAVWFSQKRVQSIHNWNAIGYGLAISLLFSQANGSLNPMSFFVAHNAQVVPLKTLWYVGYGLLHATLFASAILLLKREQIALYSRTAALALLACGALSMAGYFIPGLSAAVLILVLGFSLGNRLLVGCAVLALVWFLSHYYYQLHASLLFKSAVLALSATGLLGLRWFVLRHNMTHSAAPTEEKPPSGFTHKRGALIAGVTGALLLVMINLSIVKREQLVTNGSIVLLELTPVDPRSLMQGDYMALRFKVAREAFARPTRDRVNASEADTAEASQDGYIVVTLDAHGVGQFVGLATSPEKRQANQVALRYRIRNHQAKFATNAFFFEEGQAKVYEAARYGEFRVAPDGEMILTQLRDANYLRLGRKN